MGDILHLVVNEGTTGSLSATFRSVKAAPAESARATSPARDASARAVSTTYGSVGSFSSTRLMASS
jgi:hypothetical protein